MRKWTEDEIIYLKQNFPHTRTEDIATKLNRTISGTYHKAQKLHLEAKYRACYRDSKIEKIILNLTEYQKGYLAGIVDGEGSISFKKAGINTPHGFVKISNTDSALLKELQRWFGSETLHIFVSKRPTINQTIHKDVWDFRIECLKEVWSFLKAISPYLIVKRKQAELMQFFCESRLNKSKAYTYSDEELALVAEVKKLNKRGKTEDLPQIHKRKKRGSFIVVAKPNP